ncbi:Phosphoinositide 5-phosphatase [Aphelenchoides bicaudatus]|nr:Phosphoinositide 5-phosphatase [Aphelenchoides bicaudatus]
MIRETFIVEMYKKVDSKNPPELIVFGLQEVVDINSPVKAKLDGRSKEKLWRTALSQLLNNYVEESAIRMLGIFLIVMKKKSAILQITNKGTDDVPTGMLNQYGNKGGVGVRTTTESEEKLKFKGKVKTMDEHDIIIFMGDTNSRIDSSNYEEVVRKVNAEELDDLLKMDQLRASHVAGKAYRGFYELEPSFKPTFKYTPGTNEFDRKKMRTPSWCDRILFKVNGNVRLEQLSYISLREVKLSDHKPVQAMFQMTVENYCTNDHPCGIDTSRNTGGSSSAGKDKKHLFPFKSPFKRNKIAPGVQVY